jgi:hypothetical protein
MILDLLPIISLLIFVIVDYYIEKKTKTVKRLVGFAFIITVIATLFNSSDNIKEKNSLNSSIETLRIQNANLDGRIGVIIESNEELREEIWKRSIPITPDSTTLNSLRKELLDSLVLTSYKEANKPKLEIVESRLSRYFNDSTGLYHSFYPFRSSPNEELFDYQIEIRFDKPFKSIRDVSSAGISINEKHVLKIDTDKKGFIVEVFRLNKGNTLTFEVISDNQIKITRFSGGFM